MTAVRVSESRTVPVSLEAAYAGTATVPLPDVFVHRHLALPPVTRVEGQDGEWAREVGQTRTIHTSDGGSLHETLTVLAPPHRFAYRIDRVRGPMRPLVATLDGEWTFAAADPGTGTGTTITWSWALTPTSPLSRPAVALVGRMWHGYARHALATLESILTT
jgi:polyketide cyclase/dehydrase/lipid transport protein